MLLKLIGERNRTRTFRSYAKVYIRQELRVVTLRLLSREHLEDALNISAVGRFDTLHTQTKRAVNDAIH
jgi:hypothetical protein